MQYVLVYSEVPGTLDQSHPDERRLTLYDGETLLGRALTCDVRFNAPTVSREHARLTAAEGRLIVENLSSTTGTRVNGKAITGKFALVHGDELRLGPVRLRVEAVVEPGTPLLPTAEPADDGLPEEATLPGSLELVREFDEYAAVAPQAFRHHTCPACRLRVAFGERTCTRCGYMWPSSNPGSLIQHHTSPNLKVPQSISRQLPLVYASDEMTVDVNIDDLRAEGVFVPSLLLDPVGTSCELTLLPDGAHPMKVQGKVTAVRAGDGGAAAGMEVAFDRPPLILRVWIDGWLAARR